MKLTTHLHLLQRLWMHGATSHSSISLHGLMLNSTQRHLYFYQYHWHLQKITCKDRQLYRMSRCEIILPLKASSTCPDAFLFAHHTVKTDTTVSTVISKWGELLHYYFCCLVSWRRRFPSPLTFLYRFHCSAGKCKWLANTHFSIMCQLWKFNCWNNDKFLKVNWFIW
jgi:hypothetical protein